MHTTCTRCLHCSSILSCTQGSPMLVLSSHCYRSGAEFLSGGPSNGLNSPAGGAGTLRSSILLKHTTAAVPTAAAAQCTFLCLNQNLG